MAKSRILIVDDEAGIRQLVRVFLTRHHFEVLEATSATEMFQILAKDPVDLVILDLMLPDMYGIDACKKLREISQVPVIMLTAVQGEMSTVLGFEAGADDYLEKPFSAHVLLARIRAVLRRTAKQQESVLPNGVRPESLIMALAPPRRPTEPDFKQASFGQWTFIPKESCVQHLSGRHVFLTRNEAVLLTLFLKKQQEILTREAIANALHIEVDDVESRAIDVQISRLRNKLRDKTQNNLIKSIRNKGYLLAVPVRITV
ncbi:MAG: DNA-binding response regulator [Gammaproteobacteria bacterium]|nr:DNA-binding response regulator [Gammaproteobacteria bacterium]